MAGVPRSAALALDDASPDQSMAAVWRRAGVVLLLAVTAAVTLLFELGDYRTLTEHEAFAAVPAREMLRSGDWIVPRFGGLPRLKKPPLNYWLLAATGWLCGEFSEWTMRLPSAVASMLLAGLVGYWARCWYGTTAGVAAALVQLSSLWTITYGRKAEVDMLLCLLTTAALWLIANEQTDGRRSGPRWRWTAVWCLLSVAWLAKFHYGPAMVLAAVVPYAVVRRRLRQLSAWINAVGLAVFAAAVLVWPLLLLSDVPDAWDVWRAETVGRAIGEMQPRPIWFYGPHLFSLALPWTGFAIAAAPQSWRRAWKRGEAREQFVWVWLIGQLVLLTISVNKHRHYLFAAMPAVTLLAGQGAAAVWERLRSGERRLPRLRAVAVCTVVVLTASGAFMGIAARWPGLVAMAGAIAAVVGLGGLVAVVLLATCRPRAAGLAVLTTILGTCLLSIGWVLPRQDRRAAVAEFARSVRREHPSEPICVYGLGEHSVVFYLGEPLARVEQREALDDREEETRFVITDERRRRDLERIGGARVLSVSDRSERERALLLVEMNTAAKETAPAAH
jgi:4-amino-4-deoxy-L-arabinose transferase-like glycosyltransferase